MVHRDFRVCGSDVIYKAVSHCQVQHVLNPIHNLSRELHTSMKQYFEPETAPDKLSLLREEETVKFVGFIIQYKESVKCSFFLSAMNKSNGNE